MSWDLAALPWLPAPPSDLRARCKALDAEGGARGSGLAALAATSLDLSGCARLGKSLGKAVEADATAPLKACSLTVLSNATLDLLLDPIRVGAARHGLAVSLRKPAFGQVEQELLDPSSATRSDPPDAVLLLLDHRGWGLQGAGDLIGAGFQRLEQARAALTGTTLILSTVAPPPEPLFGGLDVTVSETVRARVRAFNEGLRDRAARWGAPLLDLEHLAARVGLDRWHDPAHWTLHKLPFAPALSPLLGDHVGRLLGALRGTSRKVLVLDLDNTCWGGVIGDDGLEGIELGPGSGRGEAHVALQRYALELRGRGVVLAVCSKNDDANGRLPFREHPEMLLREEHIAVFQANWRDKASNLAAIARALNVGVDALVFVDDNPAERAIVREHLPQVAVPELPEDPALYVRAVASGGWFEAVSFNENDRQRAAQYQANAQRAELAEQVADMDAFHASLQMVIRFAPFDAIGRPRIAQLIGRSNQFNLTTRRYSAEQVAAMEADPDVVTLQVRLADRFGDNGMISVVIGRRDGDVLEIDTWLMSCRVLGRRVEEQVLAEIAEQARARGMTALRGRWIPSGRNGLVEEHYAKLGFVPAGTDGDATLWALDLATYDPPDLPFTVERS